MKTRIPKNYKGLLRIKGGTPNLTLLTLLSLSPPQLCLPLFFAQHSSAQLSSIPPNRMSNTELAMQAGHGFEVCPLTSSPNVATSINNETTITGEEASGLMDSSKTCELCGETETWICLSCRRCLCSRYANNHMVEHTKESGHLIALSTSDMSIWDSGLEAYLDVFAIPELQPQFSSFHYAKFGEEAKFPTLSLQVGGGEGRAVDAGDQKPPATKD